MYTFTHLSLRSGLRRRRSQLQPPDAPAGSLKAPATVAKAVCAAWVKLFFYEPLLG